MEMVNDNDFTTTNFILCFFRKGGHVVLVGLPKVNSATHVFTFK